MLRLRAGSVEPAPARRPRGPRAVLVVRLHTGGDPHRGPAARTPGGAAALPLPPPRHLPLPAPAGRRS
ncbi:MAG: hypothetical protein AVDCRST_MAG66-1756 [uncultured Pseudonocardia sp.]|uniref:Uncharacterized protein n=1 Tax=uncultured Pseudonocardia sp. TaxID=211455 RepID=A0A6J4P7R2_9PSEU|nr:MAG: hypothetical protein AVDCRST_MAG66-1756 [uncultured Pseudonocardia sp.]